MTPFGQACLTCHVRPAIRVDGLCAGCGEREDTRRRCTCEDTTGRAMQSIAIMGKRVTCMVCRRVLSEHGFIPPLPTNSRLSVSVRSPS